MTSVATPTKPAIGAIWRKGVIAAIVGAVINALLYVIGAALGGFPTSVLTPLGQPITLVTVIIMSVVTILAGALVYTVLSRITANPNRWFIIVTAIVFIVMIYSPITLMSVGAPLLRIVLLELMHVVAAASAVYFLTRS
jgi:hypothetical protein